MARKRKRSSGGWSSAPADVLGLIAVKLSSGEDQIAFAGVCNWWRSVAGKSIGQLLIPLTPRILPISYNTNTVHRVFHNLSRSRSNHQFLPEIQGCNVYGSSFGWLITTRVRMNLHQARIDLFNPVTRHTIPLPDPIKAFCFDHYAQFCVFKALLTAVPGDSNCFVVIKYEDGKLAFTKPGFDSSWFKLVHSSFHVLDFVYFNRKLYAVGDRGWLAVLDLSSYYNPRLRRSLPSPILNHWAPPPSPLRPHRERYHLLELGNELCMVLKYSDYYIQIYKIDVDTRVWTPVESLGNLCLLLQDDVTFISVNADDHNKLLPGCIYYPNTGSSQDEDAKLVPECIYYPHTARLDVEHHKLLIPRCIYYPTTTEHGNGMWSARDDGPNLLPHVDAYSMLYPSVMFTPSLQL